LAVYRFSLTVWNQERLASGGDERKDLFRNVIVNGDDMLFKADQRLIDIFRNISSSCGFKISQGKNYVSPDCCMINSQVFRRVQGTMKRFGYLNLKLVKQYSIKNETAAATPFELGAQLTKMVKLCPWTACAVPEAFRTASLRFGLKFPFAWYLPLELGGFGADRSIGPQSWRATREQRLLAACFVSERMRSLRTAGKGRRSILSRLPAMSVGISWVIGSGPPPEGFGDFKGVATDPWMERLTVYDRLNSAEKAETVVDRKLLFPRIPRRLSPMSHDRLNDYVEHGRLFVKFLNVGPPKPLRSFDYGALAHALLPGAFASFPFQKRTWTKIDTLTPSGLRDFEERRFREVDGSVDDHDDIDEIQETVDGTGGSSVPDEERVLTFPWTRGQLMTAFAVVDDSGDSCLSIFVGLVEEYDHLFGRGPRLLGTFLCGRCHGVVSRCFDELRGIHFARRHLAGREKEVDPFHRCLCYERGRFTKGCN
jgi:hypothetical protein